MIISAGIAADRFICNNRYNICEYSVSAEMKKKLSFVLYISEVPFDAEVEYRCTNGMRSAADLGFVSQVATCRPGNVWEAPPAWESCTPSKGASRYDVRIGGGSWKSGRSKGGCMNFIL